MSERPRRPLETKPNPPDDEREITLDTVPTSIDRTADLMGKLLQVPKEEADEVHRNH